MGKRGTWGTHAPRKVELSPLLLVLLVESGALSVVSLDLAPTGSPVPTPAWVAPIAAGWLEGRWIASSVYLLDRSGRMDDSDT